MTSKHLTVQPIEAIEADAMLRWADQDGQIFITPTALYVEGKPEFETYQSAFDGILNTYNRAGFYLGDLLVAAEQQYGELYAQLGAKFNYRRGTLYNFTYVSRAIPPERRRNLDFGHHQVVASLPALQADALLEQAEEHDWTVSELRAEKDKAQGKPRGKTLRQTLEELVAKWRRNLDFYGEEGETGIASAIEICANELSDVMNKYRF